MDTDIKLIDGIQFWQRENSLPSIPTFSHKLDNILGCDGIPLGSLMELLGLPGTGKTQLCLQLCASVQIPEELGGLNAEALYVDTNTNFVLERFKEILSASLSKCQKLLSKLTTINEEEALKKLQYVNAFGFEKFCAFMYQLPKFVAEHSNLKQYRITSITMLTLGMGMFNLSMLNLGIDNSGIFSLTRGVYGEIRLIVIDSIAFPFKEGITAKQRTGLLFRQMADLQRLAVEKQIAVVLTNEMSTRLGLSTGAVVGSFGDAWAHRCNVRMLLSAPDDPDGERLALILKSNVAPEAVAPFQITAGGIRDVN